MGIMGENQEHKDAGDVGDGGAYNIGIAEGKLGGREACGDGARARRRLGEQAVFAILN